MAARRGRRRPPRRDRDRDVVLGWTLENGFSLAAREKENVSTHGRGRGYGLPAKTMHEKELTDVKRDQTESFFNDCLRTDLVRQTYSNIVVPTRRRRAGCQLFLRQTYVRIYYSPQPDFFPREPKYYSLCTHRSKYFSFEIEYC